MMHFYVLFFSGVFSSAFLALALLPFLKAFFVDYPNSRSSHNNPIPRAGGIVFVLIPLIYTLFSNTSLSSVSLLALPLAFVGFLDDKFNLSRLLRYLVQLLSAFFAFGFSPLPGILIEYHIPFVFSIILLSFVLLFVTATINFVNFMDGIDGIVAGCFSVVFMSSSIILSDPYLVLISGVLCGFLLLNWSPSILFMGDVGSTFLGFCFAFTVLSATSYSLTYCLAILLIATPVLVDPLICVIRRSVSQENIFKPHRKHLYQRLVRSGMPHSSVSAIYILSTIFLSIIYFNFTLLALFVSAIFVLTVAAFLDYKFAIPFSS